MELSLLTIVHNFDIKGSVLHVKPYGSGHINDTFKVTNYDSQCPNYLLQRVNNDVFKDVEGVMDNIANVTNYISHSLGETYDSDVESKVLTLVPTCTRKNYLSINGTYWRMFEFLENYKSYDFAETPEQVYDGASAFGSFLKQLEFYPVQSLAVTIPYFHNIFFRIRQFNECLEKIGDLKKSDAYPQIRFVRETAYDLCQIQQMSESGELPTRVTHNDTKINNVLLDKEGNGRCVIDLDTVMPGLVHYDFGDGIRTGACTAIEDEKDLQLVDIDIEKFKAFSEGYLEETADILSRIEKHYLVESAALLPFIMGVRFLTDHLQGDKYYKTNYKGHNLVRAKNQLHLTAQIQRRYSEMKRIISSISSVANKV